MRGVSHLVVWWRTCHAHQMIGTWSGSRNSASVNSGAGRDLQSRAIWMLAGKTNAKKMAAGVAETRRVRDNTTPTARLSSAALVNVQTRRDPGRNLGTIASNPPGATKWTTPAIASSAASPVTHRASAFTSMSAVGPRRLPPSRCRS